MKLKKCRECGIRKSKDEFVDIDGNKNTRGHYCFSCYKKRLKDLHTAIKENRAAKIRKYNILYGEYWEYYATPVDFSDELFEERDFCPYCGKKFPKTHPDSQSYQSCSPFVHIDHMDPLIKGGEDSIRNAVCVCAACNLKKGDRLFIDWVQDLKPRYKKLSYEIYKQKHGHRPESFKAGNSTPRSTGIYYELRLDEDELEKMHPEPMVTGPPTYGVGIVIRLGENLNLPKK